MVSGGFDPLHGGHINLLESAKKLGDVLVVGLNSDDWLFRKKGKPFMDFWQRLDIMANLKMVDHVVPFNDDDDTATQFILDCKKITAKIAFTFLPMGEIGSVLIFQNVLMV